MPGTHTPAAARSGEGTARRWLCALVPLLLCTTPAAALAQTAASPGEGVAAQGDEAKAKALFLEAQALFKDGFHAQALVKFHASYDLIPLNEILYNIALCYEKLGQKEAAVKYYKAYLPTEQDPAEKEKIEKKVAQLLAGDEGNEEGGGETKEGQDDGYGEGADEKVEVEGQPKKKLGFDGPRGGWLHGLRLLASGDMTDEKSLNVYSPAWAFRAGYNLRFKEGKGTFAVELGIGALYDGFFKTRLGYHSLVSLMAGWEVFGSKKKKRAIQIFIGGNAEFKYFFKIHVEGHALYAGGGPWFSFEWNLGRGAGIVIDFVTLAGYVDRKPYWGVDFIFKIGLVWGLK